MSFWFLDLDHCRFARSDVSSLEADQQTWPEQDEQKGKGQTSTKEACAFQQDHDN
jgi:hypothetical protein